MSNASGPADVEMTNVSGSRHIRRNPLLYAGVVLVSVVYFLGIWYYAQVRPVEADEGYYTTAARLVWEGETPYRNFCYPQGALLPYLYSWIWAIHPRSLIAMRSLSAALGAIAVFLWGISLLSVKRLSTKVALASFAVIVLNPYWVSWNVVVKTFAASNLLMSATMICLYAALQSELRKMYFLGGLALGACASVRSLYAPLAPFLLLWLLHREWRTSKWPFPKTLTFLGGATCGLLPALLSFAVDPRAFLFDSMQYRNLLNPHETLRHVVHGYLTTSLALLQHFHWVLLLLLAIRGGLSLRKLSKKQETPYTSQDYEYCRLAFLMLLVYLVTAMIPFPVYDQYFTSPLLPFLVPFVAEGLRVTIRFGTKSLVPLTILALTLFFLGIRGEVGEYSSQPAMQLASYRSVAQVIAANSSPSDVVLSIWPGYVFESGRRYFPGSENHFNYMVGYKLTAEARMRYHVLSGEDVTKAISKRAVDVFVSAWSGYHLESTMTRRELAALRAALNSNYSLVGSIDHVEVYRRR